MIQLLNVLAYVILSAFTGIGVVYCALCAYLYVKVDEERIKRRGQEWFAYQTGFWVVIAALVVLGGLVLRWMAGAVIGNG